MTPAPWPRIRRWLALLAPIAALWVIRPWIPGAFPVWDYAEMLPLLRGSDGVLEAFARLAEFTRLDGRANYLTYLQIAVTWSVSGAEPIGWQWQRAILMVIMGTLVAATVLRFRGTPLAAGAAGLLATLTVSATEGWLFLMGEPLAAIALLAMILLLTVRTGGRLTPGTGVAVAALALAVLLAKEVVGLAVPLALVLGLAWDAEGGLSLEQLRRPPRLLLGLLATVALLAGTSVIAALGDAAPGAYATAFDPSIAALDRVPGLFLSMLLPAQFSSAGLGSLLYPANLAFLAGLVVAAAVADRRRPPGARTLALVLLAAPLVGAVTYAFWPRYSAFYGIPFSLGGVGLLAAAITILQRAGSRAWSAGAAVLAVAVTGYTAVVSHRTVGDKRGIADLAAGIARVLGRTTQLDSVLVVRAGPGANRWPVTGPELSRYAVAIGGDPATLPVIRDASCDEVVARHREPLGRVGILNDRNPCGPLPQATYNFVATVPYRDWLTLGRHQDTIAVQLLVPPSDTGARTTGEPSGSP